MFPLAVHMGGYSRCGEKINILRNAVLHEVCGRGPQCDRQGKNFTKPFNLTLAVVFLTSDLYWLSHVESLGISEKAVLPPETPPKFLPLTVLGGKFTFQQLSFRCRYLLKNHTECF